MERSITVTTLAGKNVTIRAHAISSVSEDVNTGDALRDSFGDPNSCTLVADGQTFIVCETRESVLGKIAEAEKVMFASPFTTPGILPSFPSGSIQPTIRSIRPESFEVDFSAIERSAPAEPVQGGPTMRWSSPPDVSSGFVATQPATEPGIPAAWPDGWPKGFPARGSSVVKMVNNVHRLRGLDQVVLNVVAIEIATQLQRCNKELRDKLCEELRVKDNWMYTCVAKALRDFGIAQLPEISWEEAVVGLRGLDGFPGPDSSIGLLVENLGMLKHAKPHARQCVAECIVEKMLEHEPTYRDKVAEDIRAIDPDFSVLVINALKDHYNGK
jgi:uncharacterized protein YlzI (FlbEa/FlbD family)